MQDIVVLAKKRADKFGVRNVVVVLTPCKTQDIFNHVMRIKDQPLVPEPKDRWFDDKPLWEE